MNKSAKRTEGRKALGAGQLWLRLPGLVGEALYETVIGVGLACVAEALEAERMRLCGARYAHMAGRQALRGGHVRRVNHFCLPRQSFMSVVAKLKGLFHPITSRVAAAIFRFGPPLVESSFSEERF